MPNFARKEDSVRHDGLEQGAVLICPRRRAEVRTRLVNGETVVLDRHEQLIHQFNRTASYIWERCDGQRTPAEIAGQVCEAFEVDPSTALRDVLEIIRRLQKLKLLETP
jgi:hypothetical protein